MAARDETALERSNEATEVVFEPVSYDLGDDFVANVAHAYRPEVLHGLWVVRFGDEH